MNDDQSSVYSENQPEAENAEEQARLALEEERKTLAAKEDRAVRYLRFAVVGVLLAAAALVSTFVGIYLKNDQQEDFESSFYAHATKVIEQFHQTVDRKMEAMDTLAVAYTSYAKETGAVWPNVSLPDSEIRMAGTRALADTSVINFYPLVTDETRIGWEAYMRENRDYFEVAERSGEYQRRIQDEKFGHKTNETLFTLGGPDRDVIENFDLTDFIDDPAPPGTGPYLPAWQFSPVVLSQVLGFNALSHPGGGHDFQACLGTSKAILGSAINLNGENADGNTAAYFKNILGRSQYRYGLDVFLVDPTSTLAYPIYDSFIHETRKVVGVLGSNVYWRMYFENILPSTARGILAVIENTRGQSFTYRIDGSETFFMGDGDLHEAKYDHMGLHGSISSHLETRKSPASQSYTSAELATDYVDYTIHIFPSGDTENEFTNSQPFIASMVVLAIFLFCGSVFLLYDSYVRRRQRIVMSRALASSAIVSSLFPGKVRDQMYEEKEEKLNAKKLDAFSTNESRPIAEKFDHTTILFADLAGFTKWSSTRTPEQVFTLLETIYHAFDEIAFRRKVFKVETIGDCYVAVTGVPEPQANHAVIMVKFAQECMDSLHALLNGLVDTLGPDTASLKLRVGCHSGSVTGGVLRGDKGRFQLFGDTMNTASRMESNGIPGKIHVSEACKAELVAKGKGQWLQARLDKIVAKGKGELQTFFVCPTYGVGASSTAASSSFGTGSVDGDEEDLMERITEKGESQEFVQS